MIGTDPAYRAFLAHSKTAGEPSGSNDTESVTSRPRSKTTLQRIVVVCDGTVEGDSAPQLAAGIARGTAAGVRAVTWLTPAVARAVSAMDRAPIEELLDRVTQQLYRFTKNPGFWRLALVTGDLAPAIVRIAREEHADCVIIPGRHIGHETSTRIAWATSVPVIAIFGVMGTDDYHVRVTAVQTVACQRLTRIAEAMIAAVVRRDSDGPTSVRVPIDTRTVSLSHASISPAGDDSGYSMLN